MYQVEMATIRKRKRKDGSYGYTAQIRIMQGGVQVYQESQTFDRHQTAKAWATKREAELAAPGAIARANRKGDTQAGWSTTVECNAGKKGKAKAEVKKERVVLEL